MDEDRLGLDSFVTVLEENYTFLCVTILQLPFVYYLYHAD